MTAFEADADRLSAHAKDFAPIVDRATRISAELEQALGGAPWGDDVVGRSFSAAHTAPAADALDRVKGLADGLGGAGGSFAEAARRYQAGDAAAADTIRDA
ncbi:hypothetical protein [Amycolatopsis sp. GM8]|uniref:hypothetical protein n=1 Tax=Amycolatopsis sp. GM8 TaxID=2896530 RepID=UPI001F16829D|nr:hypothetical protein [Amycolatopsis sp. GM8]